MALPSCPSAGFVPSAGVAVFVRSECGLRPPPMRPPLALLLACALGPRFGPGARGAAAAAPLASAEAGAGAPPRAPGLLERGEEREEEDFRGPRARASEGSRPRGGPRGPLETSPGRQIDIEGGAESGSEI